MILRPRVSILERDGRKSVSGAVAARCSLIGGLETPAIYTAAEQASRRQGAPPAQFLDPDADLGDEQVHGCLVVDLAGDDHIRELPGQFDELLVHWPYCRQVLLDDGLQGAAA